jgi:cell wall-associated NlpC family hydrolase
MTAASMPPARRPLAAIRRAVIALTVGAGVVLSPLPAQANAPGPPPPPATAPPSPVVAPTHAAQVAVDTAMAQLGKPYVWAGAGPDVFDCSGLTMYAYAAAGIALPHSSNMQSGYGTPVARTDLQPGDLVFFYDPIGHVGMYVGNGQMIHSPHTGDVVRLVDLDYMYGYATARRLA